MEKSDLIKEIQSWIKDYDGNEEHDMEMAIALKDDARRLLEDALVHLA